MSISHGGQSFLGSGSKAEDQFDRSGHPGRFYREIDVVSGSTVVFTGSNYGAGGIVVPTGTTGTVVLSGGGQISLAHLAGSIYPVDLSVRSVNVTGGGPVYVLIKNHVVF